jgi:hypothetical protein
MDLVNLFLVVLLLGLLGGALIEYLDQNGPGGPDGYA